MAVMTCEISNNLEVDVKASPATTTAVYAIPPDATRQVRIAYEYVEEPQRFQALALLYLLNYTQTLTRAFAFELAFLHFETAGSFLLKSRSQAAYHLDVTA